MNFAHSFSVSWISVSDAAVIALVLQLNVAGSNPTVIVVIICLGVVTWA